MAGLAVSVDSGDVRPVDPAVVVADASVDVLVVGVGVADGVVVDIVVALVSVGVGKSSGPVPDGGTKRVATIVACVRVAASDTPTHMLYAMFVASPVKPVSCPI